MPAKVGEKEVTKAPCADSGVLAAVISITPVTLALLLVLMGDLTEPMVMAGVIHALVKGESLRYQKKNLTDGNPLSELGLAVVAMLPTVLMMWRQGAELGAHYAAVDLLITAFASLLLAAAYETVVVKKEAITHTVTSVITAAYDAVVGKKGDSTETPACSV